MAGKPTSHSSSERAETPETLAEMLFPLIENAKRDELEQFRIEFEAIHGPTDLTKRYTSTWPKVHQDWLVEHDPKRWFDGLPSFVKMYLRGKLQMAARDGKLDDMPDGFIRLYVSKELKLDHEEMRGR